jgi:hypothetical protein
MRRFLVGSMVMTVFVVVPLAVTAQNNNDKKAKTTQATAAEYATLARLSQVVGKIVSTDAEKITVSIEHPHAVRNTGTSTNGRPARPSTTIQHDQIEFDLPMKEKAVVKKMYTSSSGFDDKGNSKSAGTDAKKPATAPGGGTLCDITDLVPGTVVRLQLGSPKKQLKAGDDASDLATHSTVNSVTALSEPKDQMAADNGKKKKNQ